MLLLLTFLWPVQVIGALLTSNRRWNSVLQCVRKKRELESEALDPGPSLATFQYVTLTHINQSFNFLIGEINWTQHLKVLPVLKFGEASF